MEMGPYADRAVRGEARMAADGAKCSGAPATIQRSWIDRSTPGRSPATPTRQATAHTWSRAAPQPLGRPRRRPPLAPRLRARPLPRAPRQPPLPAPRRRRAPFRIAPPQPPQTAAQGKQVRRGVSGGGAVVLDDGRGSNLFASRRHGRCRFAAWRQSDGLRAVRALASMVNSASARMRSSVSSLALWTAVLRRKRECRQSLVHGVGPMEERDAIKMLPSRAHVRLAHVRLQHGLSCIATHKSSS